MRFQSSKGDHKMITDKKCPKSYFIAQLQAARQNGESHSQSWHEQYAPIFPNKEKWKKILHSSAFLPNFALATD